MSKENQTAIKIGQVVRPIPFSQENVIINKTNLLCDYLAELLSLQYDVNQALLINSILTDQFIKQSDESTGKTSSSEGSTLVSGRQKKVCDKNEKRPLDIKMIENKKKRRAPVVYEESNTESQYQPSEQQQVAVQYKLSQSKNVPKNYGKSILNFIKRSEAYTKRILCRYNLNFQQFQEYLAKYKNNINTIAQLRSLWVESGYNKFARVLRTISCQYLRKHSLSHIFNSRVQNFAKHIKYRQKILKAIQKPHQFTQMKDF